MNTYTHTKTKLRISRSSPLLQSHPTYIKPFKTAEFLPSHSKIIGRRESLYKDNIRHKPEAEGVSGGITCSHESWKFLGAFDIKQ